MTWPDQGARMVKLSWLCTVAFVFTAGLAAWRLESFQRPALGVALVLFGLGMVTMLWAFFVAVGRSRTEAIGVGGLYFGAGAAPRLVRMHLLGATAIQLVVSIVTASLQPFTTVAFGTLVPICGLGFMGLWTARYGVFGANASDH